MCTMQGPRPAPEPADESTETKPVDNEQCWDGCHICRAQCQFPPNHDGEHCCANAPNCVKPVPPSRPPPVHPDPDEDISAAVPIPKAAPKVVYPQTKRLYAWSDDNSLDSQVAPLEQLVNDKPYFIPDLPPLVTPTEEEIKGNRRRRSRCRRSQE